MPKRIWELDALRGICILGMVVVHFVYDLVEFYQLVSWGYPPVIRFLLRWGGVLFLLISGICVTLGRHHVRRGLIVFGAGLLCSAVTYGMYYFGFTDRSIIIYFGVLHCLGLCMILWHPLRKLPAWVLGIVGLGLVAAGFWVDTLPSVEYSWLIPLGLTPRGFLSSDFFPLLPNFGFFLVGAVLGKTVYQNKVSLLPKVNSCNPILRLLQFCGRQSLWVYLLHQPLLNGLCYLLLLMK